MAAQETRGLGRAEDSVGGLQNEAGLGCIEPQSQDLSLQGRALKWGRTQSNMQFRKPLGRRPLWPITFKGQEER